jgi:hypothetical protein
MKQKRYLDQFALAKAQVNELYGCLLRVLGQIDIAESTGELAGDEGYDMRDISDAVVALARIHKAERETLRVISSSGVVEGRSRAELLGHVD